MKTRKAPMSLTEIERRARDGAPAGFTVNVLQHWSHYGDVWIVAPEGMSTGDALRAARGIPCVNIAETFVSKTTGRVLGRGRVSV